MTNVNNHIPISSQSTQPSVQIASTAEQTSANNKPQQEGVYPEKSATARTVELALRILVGIVCAAAVTVGVLTFCATIHISLPIAIAAFITGLLGNAVLELGFFIHQKVQEAKARKLMKPPVAVPLPPVPPTQQTTQSNGNGQTSTTPTPPQNSTNSNVTDPSTNPSNPTSTLTNQTAQKTDTTNPTTNPTGHKTDTTNPSTNRPNSTTNPTNPTTNPTDATTNPTDPKTNPTNTTTNPTSTTPGGSSVTTPPVDNSGTPPVGEFSIKQPEFTQLHFYDLKFKDLTVRFKEYDFHVGDQQMKANYLQDLFEEGEFLLKKIAGTNFESHTLVKKFKKELAWYKNLVPKPRRHSPETIDYNLRVQHARSQKLQVNKEPSAPLSEELEKMSLELIQNELETAISTCQEERLEKIIARASRPEITGSASNNMKTLLDDAKAVLKFCKEMQAANEAFEEALKESNAEKAARTWLTICVDIHCPVKADRFSDLVQKDLAYRIDRLMEMQGFIEELVRLPKWNEYVDYLMKGPDGESTDDHRHTCQKTVADLAAAMQNLCKYDDEHYQELIALRNQSSASLSVLHAKLDKYLNPSSSAIAVTATSVVSAATATKPVLPTLVISVSPDNNTPIGVNPAGTPPSPTNSVISNGSSAESVAPDAPTDIPADLPPPPQPLKIEPPSGKKPALHRGDTLIRLVDSKIKQRHDVMISKSVTPAAVPGVTGNVTPSVTPQVKKKFNFQHASADTAAKLAAAHAPRPNSAPLLSVPNKEAGNKDADSSKKPPVKDSQADKKPAADGDNRSKTPPATTKTPVITDLNGTFSQIAAFAVKVGAAVEHDMADCPNDWDDEADGKNAAAAKPTVSKPVVASSAQPAAKTVATATTAAPGTTQTVSATVKKSAAPATDSVIVPSKPANHRISQPTKPAATVQPAAPVATTKPAGGGNNVARLAALLKAK